MSKIENRTKPVLTAESTSKILNRLGIKDRVAQSDWLNNDEEIYSTIGFGATKSFSTPNLMREGKLVPLYALEDKSFTPK
ncbi:MAG: hypothetical protein WC627_12885 [Legionella sp.]|jgi:hypothetical protein